MTDEQLTMKLDAMVAALKGDGNVRCAEICAAAAKRLRELLKERRK
jgi:hypothetical protein